jgi:hypothetical protein
MKDFDEMSQSELFMSVDTESEHKHESENNNAEYSTARIPSRKRKADQIYMSNVAKPVVLVDEITSELANNFLQHCERPEVIHQNLQWDQVIQPYALERIRLRLTNTKFHHLVLPEHVDDFPLRIVDGEEVCFISLLEITTIIKKMFNVTPEVSDEQSLEQQGREHTFKYSMKHEDVEDTSLLSFKRICSNSLSHMTPELNNRMAVIMGNKMPRNTGMALQYELRTLQESPNKTDTVPKSLKRIKVILQEKREHMRLSNEAGPDEYCSVIDEKDKILSNAAPTVPVRPAYLSNIIAKCQACGMTNHNRKHCAFKHHDLANNTSQPWDHSPKGKLWAESGKPCFTLNFALPGHDPVRQSG